MADDTSALVGKLFDLANTWSVPLVSQLANKKSGSGTQIADKSVVNEVANNSRLNGSGPADPSASVMSSPTTLQSFISGNTMGNAVAKASNSPMMFYGFIGLGIAVLYFVFKRK